MEEGGWDIGGGGDGNRNVHRTESIHMDQMFIKPAQWRIYGGGALPPKIFSISCSFSQNLANSYVGASLEGWRPLLRGILDLPLLLVISFKNSFKYVNRKFLFEKNHVL